MNPFLSGDTVPGDTVSGDARLTGNHQRRRPTRTDGLNQAVDRRALMRAANQPHTRSGWPGRTLYLAIPDVASEITAAGAAVI